MLKGTGGNVKSFGIGEKSWENIWWNEKYFVPLYRESEETHVIPSMGGYTDKARNLHVGMVGDSDDFTMENS